MSLMWRCDEGLTAGCCGLVAHGYGIAEVDCAVVDSREYVCVKINHLGGPYRRG